MSIEAKTQYLGRIYDRYQRAGRRHKSKILDEFCAVCGYHRKAALRLLNRSRARAAKRRPGPKPISDAAKLLGPLKTIWLSSEQPCGQRLKEIIPLWLPHLKKGVSSSVRQQLFDLSAATMDRLLAPARARHPRRGLSTTKPGSLLRHQVALRGATANTTEPGHLEADTVAHCGDTTAGDFIYSLTVTDPASGWTENRAVWNKGAAEILAPWPSRPVKRAEFIVEKLKLWLAAKKAAIEVATLVLPAWLTCVTEGLSKDYYNKHLGFSAIHRHIIV